MIGVGIDLFLVDAMLFGYPFLKKKTLLQIF